MIIELILNTLQWFYMQFIYLEKIKISFNYFDRV